MDVASVATYMATMTRFLLTLLALLTGLAAAGTQATARVRMGDSAEIGAVAGLAESATRAPQVQCVLVAIAQPNASARQSVNWLARCTAPTIPAFLTGIDRAHE